MSGFLFLLNPFVLSYISRSRIAMHVKRRVCICTKRLTKHYLSMNCWPSFYSVIIYWSSTELIIDCIYLFMICLIDAHYLSKYKTLNFNIWILEMHMYVYIIWYMNVYMCLYNVYIFYALNGSKEYINI